MATLDPEPSLNPETGLPRSFMELGLELHLAIWSRAAPLVVPQSRYAALLVSLHGSSLYERRDLARLEARDAERVRAFLERQRSLQESLLAGLRGDTRTAAEVSDAAVRRNRRLVWTWDSLSLGLLLGWAPYKLEGVPAAAGDLDVAVRPGTAEAMTLDPWPFDRPRVSLRCEGRRLAGRSDDEAAMRNAFAAAPWVRLEIELINGIDSASASRDL